MTHIEHEHEEHAVWLDLAEFNGEFRYVVDIDQHRFFSLDGENWVDAEDRIATTIGFRNAVIVCHGGPNCHSLKSNKN